MRNKFDRQCFENSLNFTTVDSLAEAPSGYRPVYGDEVEHNYEFAEAVLTYLGAQREVAVVNMRLITDRRGVSLYIQSEACLTKGTTAHWAS